jgi:hypothetical protein
MGGILALIRESERLAVGVTVAAVIAGLLLVATEFSTVTWVDVANGSCEVINDSDPKLADRCKLSGFERHGGAVALLGIFAIMMGWGAGVGASRPAAIALLGIGAVVLAIAVFSDIPESSRTGAIGPRFSGAEGKKGTGLYLELAGGALALAAGAARLASDRSKIPPANS